MSILNSFPAMQLIEQFSNLNEEILNFCLLLKKDECKIIIPQQTMPHGYKKNALLDEYDILEKMLLDVWYTDNEDGRSTKTYQGVILGTDDSVLAAKKINKLKDEFHKSVMSFTKGKSKDINLSLKESFVYFDKNREKLKRLGIQRINLNSCYRRIPVLDSCPEKIGYCLQKKSLSITKITVKEARDLLEKRNKKRPVHIQKQIKKIENLSENFILARIQQQAPIIKANIVFKNEYKDTEMSFFRNTKKPPLPMIMPKGKDIPDIKFLLSDYSGNERLKRYDRRIEDKPFLPSIRVYRYINSPT